MKMENGKPMACTLLLWLYFFVGKANGLTCYSGRITHANINQTINATTQCSGMEICVIYNRFTVDEDIFSTTKGCLSNCTNKCVIPPDNKKSCYICCAENLCNGEKKQTTDGTTAPLHPTNTGTGGKYWNFFSLAFVTIYLVHYS